MVVTEAAPTVQKFVDVPCELIRYEPVSEDARGEVVIVELLLPEQACFNGTRYYVIDPMLIGQAFRALPTNPDSMKDEAHYYSRSANQYGVLQSIINESGRRKTSRWWVYGLDQRIHETIPVRLQLTPDRNALCPQVHPAKDRSRHLVMDPIEFYRGKKFLFGTLSTGLSGILGIIRCLAEHEFGGAHVILEVSVKYYKWLMFHDELVQLALQYPDNFEYIVRLTQEDPPKYDRERCRRGRMVVYDEPSQHMDYSPLVSDVPDIEERHTGLCGSFDFVNKFREGLSQTDAPRLKYEFRGEGW